MKHSAFLSAMLAAILLLTLSACRKTQSPAAPETPDASTQQTEQKQETEPSTAEPSVQPTEQTLNTEPSGVDTAPTEAEENTQEEPWQTALAESLMENYGVLPEYYEDLGDGIYLVYVEVGGEIVPFVTVDSATGEYHG